MTWVNRLQLRHNLAIVTAIGALGTAYLMLAFSLYTNRYEPQFGEPVDYGQLMSDFSEREFNTSTSAFILLASLFIISLIFTPHGRGGPAILVFLIALMVAGFAGLSNIVSYETVLTHQQSLEFGNNSYHLVLQSDHDDDYTVFNYLIFECAPSEVNCVPIHSKMVLFDDVVANLVLSSSGDALHLQIGGETVYTVQATEAAIVEDNDA